MPSHQNVPVGRVCLKLRVETTHGRGLAVLRGATPSLRVRVVEFDCSNTRLIITQIVTHFIYLPSQSLGNLVGFDALLRV